MQQQSFDKRINSFTQKPSSTQILSYTIVITDILIFYICIHRNLSNSSMNNIVSIMFGFVSICLILSAFITSYMDPSDPVPKLYAKSRKQNKSFQQTDYFYCISCISFCSKTAKHCRTCNRCVVNFDHHCIWINNCIGIINYKPFFIMITSTFFQLTLFVIGGVLLTISQNYYNFLGQIILVWIYIGILGILIFLDFNLILLHLYLIYKGITTFEMIQIQKQEQKQKLRQQQIEKIQKQRKQLRQINSQAKSELRQQHIQPQTNIQQFNHDIFYPKEQLHQNQQQNKQQSSKSDLTVGNRSSRKKIIINQKVDQVESVGQVQNSKKGEQQIENQQYRKSLKVNKFFIKNKSLKFLIDYENGQSPEKKNICKKNLSFSG